MALYADKERGRYPIWQSLDHVNFLPGSGVLFVTVTVRTPLLDFTTQDLIMHIGRLFEAN